jgi:glycosyltransferase involved in cell wall biosynthesis
MSGNIPLHFYRSTFVGLIDAIDPDVIYAHHEPYAAATIQLYMANRLTRKCPIGFYSAQNIRKRYPLPFHLGEQFVFEQSAFAFPVSRTVENVLRAKGYRAPATVLPLGVDPAIYRPHPDSAALASRLREGSEDLLIGYLGRLTEEKGLRTLLHALAELHPVSWRLVVVGSGDYESEFVEIARRLGLESRISLVGFVPHPQAPRYLSAFDILVLPSESRPNWKEQFGRVVVEALACGTPVVGSDSGEIPYVIDATGGGAVFREGDPSDLARAILQLAKSPEERRRMVVAGQSYVNRHLENGPIASLFVATVSKAIAGNGR